MKRKALQMNLQKFAGKTNVFPVLDNKFKVGKTKESATTIADMETQETTTLQENSSVTDMMQKDILNGSSRMEQPYPGMPLYLMLRTVVVEIPQM